MRGSLKLEKEVEAELIRTSNEAISAIEDYDQNDKVVNEIYLSTIARENLDFTATQATELWLVASQCPLSGGNAVFKARSIYRLIDPEVDFGDDFDLCNAEGIVMNQAPVGEDNHADKKSEITLEKTGRIEKDDYFHINPNPATDYLHLSLGEKWDHSSLFLINPIGMPVIKVKAKAHRSISLNVSNLPAGVYWLKAENEQGAIELHKIVIIN